MLFIKFVCVVFFCMDKQNMNNMTWYSVHHLPVINIHSLDPFAQALTSCGCYFHFFRFKVWVCDVFGSDLFHVGNWDIVLIQKIENEVRRPDYSKT